MKENVHIIIIIIIITIIIIINIIIISSIKNYRVPSTEPCLQG